MNAHPQELGVQAIWPWFYTDHEGGTWQPWRAGPITAEHLADAQAHARTAPGGPPLVSLYGCDVHSLLFGPSLGHITGEEAAVARWDCLNGWTG